MKVFSLFLTTLLVQPIFAAPITSPHLRDLAISESKNNGKITKSATDAQVSGMLQLKDPRPEVITRSWNYFSFLSGQIFQATGKATRAESGTFELNKNSATLMPSFGAGIISKYQSLNQGSWAAGLVGRVSFNSQASPTQLASGFKVEDSRLNASIVEAGPVFNYKQNESSRLAYFFNPLLGTLNYTQTSANELATFSKNAAVYSLSLGADYALGKEISVFTNWNQRFLNGSNEVSVQKNNLELGTRITW